MAIVEEEWGSPDVGASGAGDGIVRAAS